jgi:hypothetical protein
MYYMNTLIAWYGGVRGIKNLLIWFDLIYIIYWECVVYCKAE